MDASYSNPAPADAGYAPAQQVYTEYSGFWRRFAAYIIDGIILAVIGWVIFGVLIGGVFASSSGSTNGPNPGALGGSFFLGYLLVFVINWLYFALQESSAAQATLGKRALGVKVTDLEGRRIGFGRATGRYFAKILSSLIFMIGYIMAAFTARKQALHDMIASTLVYKTR